MIKHLFKLIWNRKRSTSLLIVEIFFSFIVLFLVLSLLYYNYSFYSEPIGFDYNNRWVLKLSWSNQTKSELANKFQQLDLSLKNFNEIEEYSFCTYFSHPYTKGMWSSGFKNDKGRDVQVSFNQVDDNFDQTLGLNIIEGRWFNSEDDAKAYEPVIINKKFADEYFGENISTVGKKIVDKDDDGNIDETLEVVGVVDHYKFRGELEKEYSIIMRRLSMYDTTSSWSEFNQSTLLLKVATGTSIAFEETLVKHITDITKGWNVKIDPIDALREAHIKEKTGSIVIFSAIAFFLILNVALGLMGVIWYSINRRRPEIGLRRATGATGKKILTQIIGEAIVLGTFAISIGILFAAQVPILSLLDTTLLIVVFSIITASTLIYLLITICSFYPSVLASRIQPVEALHDE